MHALLASLLVASLGSVSAFSFSTPSIRILPIDSTMTNEEITRYGEMAKNGLKDLAKDESLHPFPYGFEEAVDTLSYETLIEINDAIGMSVGAVGQLAGGEDAHYRFSYCAANAVIVAARWQNVVEETKIIESALPLNTSISYTKALSDIYLDCYADLFGIAHEKKTPGNLFNASAPFDLNGKVEDLEKTLYWLDFVSNTFGDMAKNLSDCSLGLVEGVVGDYYETIASYSYADYDQSTHYGLHNDYSFKAFEASLQELGLNNLKEAYDLAIDNVAGVAKAVLTSRYENDHNRLNDVREMEEILCVSFRYLLEESAKNDPTGGSITGITGGPIVIPEDHDTFHNEIFMPSLQGYRHGQSLYPSVSLENLKQEYIRRVREPYKVNNAGSENGSTGLSFTLWTLADIIVISVFFGGMALAGALYLISVVKSGALNENPEEKTKKGKAS